jgi:NAD(P)-dependent dehydrogenase (short-subunit alcohol dehydrogenase family)
LAEASRPHRDVDVAQVFHWTREALLAPLARGSTVITLSSEAALRGSPLSGGYAGAKAAIRWLTSYAAAESQRAELGIRFISVLPQLTPATALGAEFAAAYGTEGPVLTTEQAGRRSPTWSPMTPTTRTPTCSPPSACARWLDPAFQIPSRQEEQA